MSTVFVSSQIWPQLTKAARDRRQRCSVAVAYFGQSASRLLPLPKGSRLVVDASEGTVKQGLTCPAELLKLQAEGVEIYSIANLHAKVYAFGSVAYVGSANVSQPSANRLVEVMLRTKEKQAVADAHEFVQSLCKASLGPERLQQLAKIYRPPRYGGGKRTADSLSTKEVAPEFPDLRLAQIETGQEWPEDEKPTQDTGRKAARDARKHKNNAHVPDELRRSVRCHFKKGQRIMEVQDDSWLCPPGDVVEVRKCPKKNAWYIYVEQPKRNRIALTKAAGKLGRGAKGALLRNGRVTDQKLAGKIRDLWGK